MYGNAGDDLFIFGTAQGGEVNGGGGKWTDVIDQTNNDSITGGPGEGGWTLQIEGEGEIIDDSEHGSIELDNASGTITFTDTEESIEFQSIDRIEW